MNPFYVARMHQGLTQDHLSTLSGVSQQLIQRAEDGLNNSPPDTLSNWHQKHWVNGPQRFGEAPAMCAKQYWAELLHDIKGGFPNKEIPEKYDQAHTATPSFIMLYQWWVNYQRWSLPDLKPFLEDAEEMLKVNGEISGTQFVVELADALWHYFRLLHLEDVEKKSDAWLIAKYLHVQLTTVQTLAKRPRVTKIPPVLANAIRQTGRKHNEVF